MSLSHSNVSPQQGRYTWIYTAYDYPKNQGIIPIYVQFRGETILKKRSFLLVPFMCLLVVSYLMVSKEGTSIPLIFNFKSEIQQGIVTIVNKDSNTQLPIKGTEYTITSETSKAVVDTITTDENGKAISGLLNIGSSYIIKQKQVSFPYQLNDEEFRIEINEPVLELQEMNTMLEHIKDVERTADGQIKIKKVYLDVATLMQKPELPNGCEIVSLTAVLNYYGYDISKTEMADKYLPKQPFTKKDGKLYGPDPYIAYGGNPRNWTGAWFSYAPPIVEAAKSYFEAVGRSNSVSDISGSSKEEIIELLNKGIPVVMWTTLDLTKPQIKASWYLYDTGEYFPAPINLHVIVLNGYEGNLVHVMNPLEGQTTYNMDTLFQSYEEMGKHALIVGGSTDGEVL